MCGKNFLEAVDSKWMAPNYTAVVAEIGINHGGSLKNAIELVKSASRAGCDAVKFQTYITEKRLPKNADQGLVGLLKSCELSLQSLERIKACADDLGLTFFSTPFDDESVEVLESLNVKMYKLASYDVTNKALQRKVSSTGKPTCLSVGMANIDEIKAANENFLHDKLCLMHCVSAYPTNESDVNLKRITKLKKEFSDRVIGYSDHTSGINSTEWAAILGAKIVEKHFKIDEDMDCVDKHVSISESAMTTLVKRLRSAALAIGEGDFVLDPGELEVLQYRRHSD